MPQTTDLADVIYALNSLTRRRILAILRRGRLSVAELCDEVNSDPLSFRGDLSRANISQHLRVLETAHLVVHQTWGTRHVYRLERRGFDELRRYLDRFEGTKRVSL